jgi:hypothetical protein
MLTFSSTNVGLALLHLLANTLVYAKIEFTSLLENDLAFKRGSFLKKTFLFYKKMCSDIDLKRVSVLKFLYILNIYIL